jgi:PAS domain S-box-containing protein
VSADEQILVLMPTARDGEKTRKALAAAGLNCTVCGDLAELCREIDRGAGAALLTEEALAADRDGRLAAVLRDQPPWSDLPLVIIAREGAGGRGHEIRESLNVSLVERPVRIRSLLSVVRAALRARRHQYAVRDHLAERRRAAETLRAERERFRVALSSIGDAVVATDTEGRLTFLNPVAEELARWDAGEARGRPLDEVFRIVNEQTREPAENPALRALREGVVVGLANHTVLVARDGSERPIDDSAAPMRDESGTPLGAVLVFRDVTERRRAQEAQARLAAIVESSEDAIISKSLDGTILSWNSGAERLFGWSAAEAVGRSITLIIPPERLDEERDILARLRRGERIDHFETERVARGGRRIDISLTISPVRNAAGRVVGASKVARDITGKKRAEGELRRQTERLRLLWEAAAVLLTTEEPDAMMRGLFAKVAPHFGLDAYFNFMLTEAGDALRLESCLGVPAEAARSIRRLELGQAVCGAVAQTRRPITATHIQQSDDPRVQLVKDFGIRAYTCNPLLAGDHLLGTLSFASRTRDTFDADELEFLRTICRYVTATYERVGLIRELREADRKKDDFIALLAHELRNPLAPIRNGLQVLRLAVGDADATVAEARAIMDRQLAHMVRLIDDLLDVSRINRNKLELRRARVELTDVVSSAIETARPAIDAEGHELTVALPQRPIFLDADLTRLAQVLSNLLTNSAKYTEPGGRIWLSAERRGGEVVVSVRDTGIGIPAESLGNIFDMFSQVDRPIERSSGGLGIGLALVKGLVEMHGGTVAAASEGPGKGSTFTVTLPVLADQPAPPVEPAGDSRAAGPGRRVLVVDDNRDGAALMAQMLRLLGNEVRTAHDGVEAVEQAGAFRPEVILMDVGMPRLNGLDATRRIRAQPWGKGIKIIALTGWGQENDRERSREAGCDGHLVKPVDLPDLEEMLAESRGASTSGRST